MPCGSGTRSRRPAVPPPSEDVACDAASVARAPSGSSPCETARPTTPAARSRNARRSSRARASPGSAPGARCRSRSNRSSGAPARTRWPACTCSLESLAVQCDRVDTHVQQQLGAVVGAQRHGVPVVRDRDQLSRRRAHADAGESGRWRDRRRACRPANTGSGHLLERHGTSRRAARAARGSVIAQLTRAARSNRSPTSGRCRGCVNVGRGRACRRAARIAAGGSRVTASLATAGASGSARSARRRSRRRAPRARRRPSRGGRSVIASRSRADLEIERKLADRRDELRDARQVHAAPEPARVHDVDQEHRARAAHAARRPRDSARACRCRVRSSWLRRTVRVRQRRGARTRWSPACEPIACVPVARAHQPPVGNRHSRGAPRGDQPSSATAAARGNVIHSTRGPRCGHARSRGCPARRGCADAARAASAGGIGSNAIHVRERTITAPARRLARGGALAIVEIQRGPRRKHRVVTRRGRGERAIDAAPRHHRRLRCQAAFENLVPADQPAPVRAPGSARCAARSSSAALLVGDAELAHARLHARRALATGPSRPRRRRRGCTCRGTARAPRAARPRGTRRSTSSTLKRLG